GDTILGTVRPGNRSFALIGDSAPQLTGSTGFAVLTPRREELGELVYFLATSEENILRLSRLADGAAYPAVRPEIVAAQECVVPSKEVIDAFHNGVGAMVDRQNANQAEDVTLAAIRDSLLPKLISGELRVPLEGAEAPSP
ncbi:MAG: restriction endonuclease subunit S, partial [Verrucomicrobiae bacterium]|nr:restriction endonuclease subunit S [Verrucomicrobiae bacterium]